MSRRSSSKPGRRSRLRTYAGDRLAELVITLGGMSVLAAVLGIFVYLVWIVVPLFAGGSAVEAGGGRAETPGRPVFVRLGEHGVIASVVSADGVARTLLLESGEVIDEQELVPSGRTMSAWAWTPDEREFVLGFDDGSIRLGRKGFESALLREDADRLARDLDDRDDDTSEEAATARRLLALERGQSAIVPARVGSARARLSGTARSVGVVTRTDLGDLRLTVPVFEMDPPIPGRQDTGRIERLGLARAATGELFIARLGEEGGLSLLVLADTGAGDELGDAALLGGGGAAEPEVYTLPGVLGSGERPNWIIPTGDGRDLITLREDGSARRYIRDGAGGLVPAEDLQLESSPVTVAGTLPGSLTIVTGTEPGGVRSHFVIDDPLAETPDARRLATVHTLEGSGPTPAGLAAGTRDRTMLIGREDGSIRVYHSTSEKVIATVRSERREPPVWLGLSPRTDAFMAMWGDGSYTRWTLDKGHPSVSPKTLFGKVHYEGASEPVYFYQPSTGEDREPKLSFVPLIWGTLKATAVAMAFAIPIAIGAAVYTSEFLDPAVRRRVKPTIELMASLPSVVLGFIAALVVAPFVRDWLAAILTGLVLVPMTVVLAAVLWQMIPTHRTRRIGRTLQLGIIAVLLAIGAGVSSLAGPAAERAMFRPSHEDVLVRAGSFEPVPADELPAWFGERSSIGLDDRRALRRDGMYFVEGSVVRPIEPGTPEARARVERRVREFDLAEPSLRDWLDSGFGSGWPGWALLLVLPVFVGLASVRAVVVDRRLVRWVAGAPPLVGASWMLGRFVLTAGASAGVAWVVAHALDAAGFDPRDSILGTFNVRNTLVVGIIMGFAVIPIIYTISEDAMQSVPRSLRLASLGTGATPWQTALRVVLPVAGSGIFSACMIGLGRAVGETMIVVMATGNSAEMTLNVFSGVRTLSANIAVELPEATAGGTLYRVLFLCGLVLFVMTFVINTTAELIRQRFRRRSAAL